MREISNEDYILILREMVNYTISNLDASELLRRIESYLQHPLKRLRTEFYLAYCEGK